MPMLEDSDLPDMARKRVGTQSRNAKHNNKSVNLRNNVRPSSKTCHIKQNSVVRIQAITSV